MCVFIDCHDWDYVDHFIAPDGTKLDCDDEDGKVPCESDPEHMIWHPAFVWSPDASDKRWGLWEDPRTTSAKP